MKEIQSKDKIRSLLSDNPFLKVFIGDWNQQDRVVDIRFEIADIDLMFYVGRTDNNLALVGGEEPADYDVYVFFIDINSNIRGQSKLICEHSKKNVERAFKDCGLNEINKIVVLKQAVYRDEEKVRHVSIDVTVYRPPQFGFARLLEDCDLLRNVTITEFGLNNGFHDGEKAFEYVQKVLKDLSEDFRLSVYTKDFQEFANQSSHSYLEGSMRHIKVKYQFFAGKYGFSLIDEVKQTEIFFVGLIDNNNPRIRVSSFVGKLEDMENLVQDFTAAWKALKKPYNNVFSSKGG